MNAKPSDAACGNVPASERVAAQVGEWADKRVATHAEVAECGSAKLCSLWSSVAQADGTDTTDVLTRLACAGAGFAGIDCAQLDAHCHVHHDQHFAMFAQTCPERHFFCMSETPREYEMFAHRGLPQNATLGLGFHPWQVSTDSKANRVMLKEFLAQLPHAWLIGEVGLDFSSKHTHTKEQQRFVFREIAQACATAPAPTTAPAPACATAPTRKRVLSIHAVQATHDTLDILCDTGCINACTCVFHWFSGTSEHLVRAREAGCYFSFSPRALATKRARAYVAQIPPDHVLFESDTFSLDNYVE